MSALLNLVDQNADTLQQMALLAYVKDPDVGEPFLEAITTYKVRIFFSSKAGLKTIFSIQTFSSGFSICRAERAV